MRRPRAACDSQTMAATTRSRTLPIVLLVAAVLLILAIGVPAAWFLTADRGRFGSTPDPCPLLAADATNVLGPKAVVRPSTDSHVHLSILECDAIADPDREDTIGVSLQTDDNNPTIFGRDLTGVSEGMKAMAGSDAVPVSGLGDEAYASPGVGWLIVRVSNLTLWFTADVELLTTRKPDEIQDILRRFATGALARLPT
jgi:hypothetical protein